MRCSSCGTENRPGSRFCDTCGQPLEAACPQCGAQNRAAAQFCSSCGTSLGGERAAGSGAAVQPAPAASPTAERRLVSVLFADLVGFTSLAEDRDPESVRDLLSRYFELARVVVERHGGTIEKFIGDAVMAVWGTPVAHEDDAERAVRSALELVDAVPDLGEGLVARAGVMTGEAAVTLGAANQGMVAGDLVNTAARLQGVAEPSTVLVGEITMRAVDRSIVTEPVGDHQLKGKVAPVPCWRAVRVVAGRGGQGRGETLEAPFVGRAEEFRQLKDLLHATGRDRRVRLVSITGPGGIGKSRLLWELEKYVDGVAEDIYWHRGRSPSYGDGVTFWALGEMVRRRARLTEQDDEATTRERIAATVAEYVPDPDERGAIEQALLALLGIGADDAGGREVLFPAWRTFFERIAQRGTNVLVFEDLQWADPGLLDFLDDLLDWSRGMPILVIALARPELLDRRPDWGAGRRNFASLALEPLHPDAMRALLEGMVPGLPAGAVEAIVARADGIPLYAVETVRTLLAGGRIERAGDTYRLTDELTHFEIPESLRALIASRLDALDPEDRRLLQDAAVLGQVFPAAGLAAIGDRDLGAVERRLEGLVRREILDVERAEVSPERGQYKFMQSLIREVAYGMLSRRDRRARHLAVARHYEALGDEELAGVLASHYVQAHAASDPGEEGDAIAAQARVALRGAAQRAAGLGAHELAVAHLEQALEVTSDPRERADLLQRAATSATVAAHEDAERFARAAIDALQEIGDAAGAGAAEALLGRVLLDASRIDDAIATLEQALERLRGLDAPVPMASLLATLSRAYMRGMQPARAIETADRALAIAEPDELYDIVAEALVNKGSALGFVDRNQEGVALLEAGVRLAARLGASSLEVRARNNLATNLFEVDTAEAARVLDDGLRMARRIGDRGHYLWMLVTSGYAELLTAGALDERVAEVREALQSARLAGDRLRLVGFLNSIELMRGGSVELDELRALAGQLPGGVGRLTLLIHEAEAALQVGDLDGAYHAALEGAVLPGQEADFLLRHGIRAATWGRSLEQLVSLEEAADRLFVLGRYSRASRTFHRAAIDALESRLDAAAAGVRAALSLLESLGMTFELARYTVDAAVLLPHDPEVRRRSSQARATLERVGAAPYLAKLDEALAAAPQASVPPGTVPTATR